MSVCVCVCVCKQKKDREFVSNKKHNLPSLKIWESVTTKSNKGLSLLLSKIVNPHY